MKWYKKMSLAAITGLSLLGLSACSSSQKGNQQMVR